VLLEEYRFRVHISLDSLLKQKGEIVTTNWSEEKTETGPHSELKAKQAHHLPESPFHAQNADATDRADTFLLEVNHRERLELLQLLEQLLAGTTGVHSLPEDSAAVCRKLRDKIHMCGS
jgi:hypothetical protein